MLLRLLFTVGLFTLIVAAQDDGQSSADVLNNKHGETPCEMQNSFQNTCLPSQQARDDNDDDMPSKPTLCICTNVFFNLWSACVYTKTRLNTSLPLSNTLQQNCTQASINITTKQPQSNASYPKWAYMHLPPSNATFDLAAAIESADGSRSHKWTTIQIVVVILVALAVASLLVGVYIYRRRKHANRQRPWMQTTGNLPRFQFPTLSTRQKVRELDRSNSWSIDEREEDLQEYQFVSYPASLQGSHASGHVRLSSSSSGTTGGPPPLSIPSEKKPPVWALPGKSIWKGPLQNARQLSDSIPRPWRTTKRVAVKNIPGYRKFRVDAADSDSPLSQHPHAESLLGHTGRSNLHNETIFEGDKEDDSDSDDEEALPLIAQEHSRSNHDAEPPANAVQLLPPSSGSGTDSPGESNSSQRTARQIPPACAPPRIPLPLPPPTPTQQPPAPPPPPTSSQQQPERTQGPPRAPMSSSSPQSLVSPQSAARSQRTPPTLPPAPTSPPPPPPTFPRRSPRSPRVPLPAQFTNPPPLPSPPLLSPPPSNSAPAPPPPRRRPESDGGSSVRSLPMTPPPAPPYVRATPAPIQVLPEPTGDTPPHSAPPYTLAIPPPAGETRSVRSGSEAARSVRRLPLPPGQ